MTVKEALQEFWDNALHPSLKPEISEEAKAIAIKALEKWAREYSEALKQQEASQ